MKILRTVLFTFFFTISACAATESDISISNVWVRATAPGQKVAAAYMDLSSKEGATLVKAETNVADIVEIHSMTMENDVMKMRMLNELAIPAGETVNLAPGGYHLMLFDLEQSLDAGQSAEFKLHFKTKAGDIKIMTVNLPIKPRAH
ncbi:MAG: copper chaperone PCu(A)C [Methylophilaceae bacterium]|nr:copper chaperone PCu(A)C [Methylophilaceae bacterium]